MMIDIQDRVLLNIKMVVNMKGSTKMINEMVKEHSLGLMVKSVSYTGLMLQTMFRVH